MRGLAAIGGLAISVAVLAACSTRTIIVQATPKAPTKGISASPPVIPPTTQPPVPSPVSTSAQLESQCVTGLYDETVGQFWPMSEITSPAFRSQVIANDDEVEDAYQVMLTNNSQVTADVDGFSVVLYGSGGDELTSDQESFGDSFITPGQSLNYTEHPFQGYYPQQGDPAEGPYAVGDVGAVDEGATCSLLNWYSDAG
jgi:hypothetical protein